MGAVAGDQLGYFIGNKAGPAVFNRPDSRLFKRAHVEKAEAFFEKHGVKTIILARFVPIVRTFITAVAGIGQMDQKKFFSYSAIGGVAWTLSMTLLGFFLGNIPWIRNNIEAMAIVIVVISIVPIIVEYSKGRREKAREAA